MNRYHLAKWFFDVLSEDGTYILGYLSIVEFPGYRTARMSVHAAPADGSPGRAASWPVSLRTGPGQEGTGTVPLGDDRFDIGAEASRLSLRSAETSLDLQYAGDSFPPAAPLIMSPDGRRRLLWLPVMPKALVCGRIRIGDWEVELSGRDGYLDYVSSDVLPPRAPVETLHWGRLHSERCDLCWTRVHWKGRTWSRLYGRTDGAPFTMEGLEIADTGTARSETLDLDWPEASVLTARGGNRSLRLGLRHERPAVESGFLNAEETGAGVFNGILRRWAKDPKGIKFFSRAELEIRDGAGTIHQSGLRCIDEYVKFRS
jgi:hypothetical protein